MIVGSKAKHKKKIISACIVFDVPHQSLLRHFTPSQAHVFVHTDMSKPRNHICSICQKAFWQKCNLIEHETTHRTTRDFLCDVCGKAFKNQRLVNLHSVMHSDVYKYECPICQKKFKKQSNCVTHSRTHQNDQVPCPRCFKCFKSPATLKNHMRLHTGDLFECTEPGCNLKFQKKYNLEKHIETNHRGLRYTCKTCKRVYTKQTNLNRHIRTVHEPKESEVAE